jgi:hypothetical protein
LPSGIERPTTTDCATAGCAFSNRLDLDRMHVEPERMISSFWRPVMKQRAVVADAREVAGS